MKNNSKIERVCVQNGFKSQQLNFVLSQKTVLPVGGHRNLKQPVNIVLYRSF